ncbi:MAG: putative 4-hydroxybenzoate polyprenyltransferase [Proteobacteria bacterium]|nr:putative 4-hydroxybenzoate polyprenyltransferase [Pseudomonadota bacterium]MBU1745906.1 putative 4-hydroxybenzoate polyprenyltransferase [Pseudomonadota bacterium]MBU1965567.1 putative 4-hydroxybenzoate polyprenyltransferase [Pseudomonadota bacterium]
MIKFSHTIFALPFALSSIVLVQKAKPLDFATVFWIIVAMVGARSAAMGFNRIADAAIDERNPRTAVREIPRGIISKEEAGFFTAIASLVFIAASAMLSFLCFWLSFPVLACLFAYSYMKRVTWLAHLFLGFTIGLAPMGVWIAVTGALSGMIAVLSLALMTYIAGFDILYACQDVAFDRSVGLHSIPARFGVEKAMKVSTLLHGVSALCLLGLYWLFPLSPVYLLFVGIITVLFFVEHRLVNPHDLSRIDMAFFHVNSMISILVLVAVFSGSALRGIL